MSGQLDPARRRPELSQHFLRSRSLAASLVRLASISSQDLVIEVGAGRGVLTRELAKRAGHLIAIEIDSRLFHHLEGEFHDWAHVELVHADFLQFQLPQGRYKVFANLPFAVTAEALRHLLETAIPPEDAYLILQKEAAERFGGWPYAPETLVSLLLKPWWHAEILWRLRKTDFEPPPRVDSVLLWLARRSRPLVDDEEGSAYKGFITAAFGRGPSIHHALRVFLTGLQIGRLAKDLRFEEREEPSALSFDQWLGLFRYYSLQRRVS